MQQEIQLPRHVRTFTRTVWNSLNRTERQLIPGTVVTIGNRVQVEYDHQTKEAVEIISPKSETPLFLLFEEIGIPDLVV